eukprot:COSAG05_NODE_179_length_14870_cov_351.155846_3_plen_317_part_00
MDCYYCSQIGDAYNSYSNARHVRGRRGGQIGHVYTVAVLARSSTVPIVLYRYMYCIVRVAARAATFRHHARAEEALKYPSLIAADFNSRLKRNAAGGRTGRFSPHKRGDDGGELMMEIMQEFDLLASNTLFKPTNKEARNTGAATYCQSKSYVQPKHKSYQSPQPPSTIDYILTPKRFRSSASSSSVCWKFSRFARGVRYDHGTVITKWTCKVQRQHAGNRASDFSRIRDEDIAVKCEAAAAAALELKPLDISTLQRPRSGAEHMSTRIISGPSVPGLNGSSMRPNRLPASTASGLRSSTRVLHDVVCSSYPNWNP